VPPEQMAAARESVVYALLDTVTAAVPVMGDAVPAMSVSAISICGVLEGGPLITEPPG